MTGITLASTADDQPLWMAGDEYTLPLPHDEDLTLALDGMITAFADALADTRLAPHAEDIAWQMVNVFHRKTESLDRRSSENADDIRQLMREDDGSEISTGNLETAQARGALLDEARDAFQEMRDHLAGHYQAITGNPWHPKSGSLGRHQKRMTAARIDARDFLNAQRQKRIAAQSPTGTYIAFAGGPDFQDYQRIQKALDATFAKYPDMVLLHGGTARGAEHIAALWARNAGVDQIVFKPDFKAQGRAAPFRRNDELLRANPIGLIAFPGNGISENLIEKARQKRIPVWNFCNDEEPA